jgi:hypothetical protein
MKIIVPVLFIFYSLCFGQSKATFDRDFEIYLNRIPILHLPFSTTCDSFRKTRHIDNDSIPSLKFNPDQCDIIGKIVNKSNYVVILYGGKAEDLIPVLIVYDRKGSIISQESFMPNQCGRILDYRGLQYFKIDKSLSIIEIDTLFHFKMDSTYSKVLGTSKKIVVSNYWVNKNGIIKKK